MPKAELDSRVLGNDTVGGFYTLSDLWLGMTEWVVFARIGGNEKLTDAHSAPVVMERPTQSVIPECSYRESIREEDLDSLLRLRGGDNFSGE